MTLRGAAPAARINWIGFRTLYLREVRRFLAVSVQTVGGPVVASLLLFLVFGVALGGRLPTVAETDYLSFIAPGLVMMGIAQNAFANTSSSLLVAKLQGNIVDLLVAPLSPMELLCGVALGGITRGLIVGGLTLIAMWPFITAPLPGPGYALLCAFGAALMFSLLGIIAGLWARRMDEQSAITSFVIAPITLLSGTFFAIGSLPPPFREIALADPLLYMVDGLRRGLIGSAETSATAAVVVMSLANLTLALLCYRLLKLGWRLKQ